MTEPQISDETMQAAVAALADSFGIATRYMYAERVLAAAVPLLRKQWEAEQSERFHVPQIAEMHNGRWGVFCAACSATVGDYVFPCRVDRTDWWANVPAHLAGAQPGGQPE